MNCTFSFLFNLKLKLSTDIQLRNLLINKADLFLYCCEYKLSNVAIRIIKLIKFNESSNELTREIEVNKYLLVTNGNGETPLMVAIKNRDKELIKAIIGNNICQINVLDKKKKNALMHAIYRGFTYTADLLIKYIASIKLDLIKFINQVDIDGNTALFRLVKRLLINKRATNEQFVFVQKLIKYGCVLDHIDKNGNTVLILACSNKLLDNETKFYKLATFIIACNGKICKRTGLIMNCLVNQENKNKETALSIALNKCKNYTTMFQSVYFRNIAYKIVLNIDLINSLGDGNTI